MSILLDACKNHCGIELRRGGRSGLGCAGERCAQSSGKSLVVFAIHFCGSLVACMGGVMAATLVGRRIRPGRRAQRGGGRPGAGLIACTCNELDGLGGGEAAPATR